MNSYIHSKLYNYRLLVLFYVCIPYLISCHARFGVNDNHVQCVETERDALLKFKQGIHVDHCGLLDSWGETKDCCTWDGIECSNHSGHVINLHLPAIDESCLEGKISDSLLELKHLKYLDLSYNDFTGELPKFIGSLANLEHLNLSNAGFTGVIPQEIGNLSRLTSLDLSFTGYDLDNIRVESLEWLSRLMLLREIDLSGIDLSETTYSWLSIVNNLPFLQVLRLDECGLSTISPASLSYINSSSALSVVGLRNNNLNDTSTLEWLMNLGGLDTNLVYLDLSSNQMFGNNSELSGLVVKFLRNLCSLQTLNLFNTYFSYDLSDIIDSISTCPHNALEFLDLSSNKIWGSVPNKINSLSSLRELHIDSNKLNGTVSEAIGQLSRLEVMSFGLNSLEGVITNNHFLNLFKLRLLRLANNTDLVVNISDNWIPPFQLNYLYLSSCKIGPDFPKWLLTQKHLLHLEISNVGILDIIPDSFWNSSLLSEIEYLSMSHNKFYGRLPNLSTIFNGYPFIDLSFNNLEGALPSFLGNNISGLNLNNNKFSEGLVTLLCSGHKKHVIFLYLSNNMLSETVPDCWEYFPELFTLHLENNNLWGEIPTSIGALDKLITLHMNNNNLSGELPMSLLNCSSLVFLDLADNSFTGYIPSKFGDSFNRLSILSLQNNRFSGSLPSTLCNLSRLQLLDLSKNYISGTVPKCVYKLEGMANKNNVLKNFEIDLTSYIGAPGYDNEMVTWKGEEKSFTGNPSLGLLKGIDLSDNKIEGEIPEGISNLIGIKFLNLSRNHFIGVIMSRVGQLTSLESLDLSHNRLSGEIPTSLAQITTLSVLDLSYNNLSGKIPDGTQLQSFDTSSYIGNPGLCGAPLEKCDRDKGATIIPQNVDNEHRIDDVFLGLYISVVLGFIIGFWGVCGTLILKRSWRHAFFGLFEDIKEKIKKWCL